MKTQRLNLAFIFLILLENFFLFYTHTRGLGQTKNATAYFVASLMIGCLLIARFYNKQIDLQASKLNRVKWNYLILASSMFPLLLIIIKLTAMFKAAPIDVRSSDIIPLIQVMVTRFVSGIPVYKDAILNFGYELYPTYLPMHWLPFVIAQKFHFDYRWMAIAVWSLSLVILFVRTLQQPNVIYKILVPALGYWVYYLLFTYAHNILTHTIELLIVAYYILFVVGLNTKNTFVTALFISFCLLSRYSLVLWLPLFAFTYIARGRQKELYRIVLLCILLVTVIYVIPFLSNDWGAFYRGYKYYDASAYGEWGGIGQYADGTLPYQLYNGTGFAHIFYDRLEHLDLMQRIKALQRTHIIVSVGICFIMGIWYWFNRKKIDQRIFLMASFKIYFSCFLAFIQVPYIYLMLVGSFVSITIFAEQLRYRIILTPSTKDQ